MRFSIARETFIALATSQHGRSMGLLDIVKDHLIPSAKMFARALLATNSMIQKYVETGGTRETFHEVFGLPADVASERWEETIGSSE